MAKNSETDILIRELGYLKSKGIDLDAFYCTTIWRTPLELSLQGHAEDVIDQKDSLEKAGFYFTDEKASMEHKGVTMRIVW